MENKNFYPIWFYLHILIKLNEYLGNASKCVLKDETKGSLIHFLRNMHFFFEKFAMSPKSAFLNMFDNLHQIGVKKNQNACFHSFWHYETVPKPYFV